MRITGYRTLTTVQEWGRPVGDANGVYADGAMPVPIVLVDTDEGITGVGLGPRVEADAIFAAIDGQDPRAVTALYDRMLRQAFKAGHAGVVFGTIGGFDTALWDIKARAAGEPLWRLLGGRDPGSMPTPPASTSASPKMSSSRPTRRTDSAGCARRSSRVAWTSSGTCAA
jgi:L-alanine-DL-glutamate epimerase-like enolase superfamily enzyme